jgi:hypothetical protein
VELPPILLGTSSFTAAGWNGSFYPRGMKPSDYLAFYAERFHTVEVDSTFYACPTARTVENWNARTPDGFVFSVKVPQTTVLPNRELVAIGHRLAHGWNMDGPCMGFLNDGLRPPPGAAYRESRRYSEKKRQSLATTATTGLRGSADPGT